jgi:serine phosphatase RsbU (regulator of sigma subunit)
VSSDLRDLSPGLHRVIAEATALPEVVVLHDPAPSELEDCALDPTLAVVAIISGGPAARAAALRAGALEVVSPDEDENEARARIETAVKRFRARARSPEDAQRELEAGLLRRDLLAASRVQRSFLPRQLPEVPGYRFAVGYYPRGIVAGDLYDVRQLDRDHVGLFTLDAMGHGISSALVSVAVRARFSPLDADARIREPHAVLADLDRGLRDADLADSPTVAFCYGVLDTARRRLSVSNAGHPLPVRLRAGGDMDHIGKTCLLLGVVAEEYVTVTVDLSPGDRVFFQTDGVEPSYGKRFLDELASRRKLSLEEQVGGALGAMLVLEPAGQREDDATVVAIEVLGAGADGVSDEAAR